MIDFERVWLPQIISYARLIAEGQLESEWLGRSPAATSVTDPDELHEQVFDDLDADAIWAESRKLDPVTPELATAISKFLDAIRCLDGSDVRLLIESDAWSKAVAAADAVVSAATLDSRPVQLRSAPGTEFNQD